MNAKARTRAILKAIIPWRYRHRLRRLQQRLDLRRDARRPVHGAVRRPVEDGELPGLRADPTAALWDEKHDQEISSYWAQNPLVLAEVQRRQTGDPKRFWLGWLFEEQLKQPVERVLSVGCGAGGHEIMIAFEGWASEVHAFDASRAGIDKARAHAAKLGVDNIDFQVRSFEDFAEAGPDTPTYDVVLFAGSLHHMRDLEGMLSRVRRSLKSDGCILFNEYVGPIYAIYPPERVALLNRLLSEIPAAYKRSADAQWKNPTIDDVMRIDPSEGVRSSLILDLLSMYFDIDMRRDFGGAILHPIFDLLDGDRLSDGSKEAEAVVNRLIETENRLMAEGALPSDMCLGIARHKRVW